MLALRPEILLLGLLVLLLQSSGVFLLAFLGVGHAATPARILLLVGHLNHLLSINVGLTYIRIL